jgi:MFS family permease
VQLFEKSFNRLAQRFRLLALAIAVFSAIGTAMGGVVAPILFGALIDTGSRSDVFVGYLIGAGLMIGAAMVHLRWGIAAERKPLEHVAQPLTAIEQP